MSKKVVLIVLAVVVAIAVSGIIGAEYYTSRPQFCGSCHTIMKNPYDSWAQSGHKDVTCVDCHFAPGKESIMKAKLRGVEHLFASLFPDAEAIEEAIEVQEPLKVSNLGCTATQCHPGQKFPNRKIGSAENVPFTHKPHDDRIIEGKTLSCGICHLDMKVEENYTISRETCYFCEGLKHIFAVYL